MPNEHLKKDVNVKFKLIYHRISKIQNWKAKCPKLIISLGIGAKCSYILETKKWKIRIKGVLMKLFIMMILDSYIVICKNI
jgi:hypothetical protein